jgi:hypothetical protein
MSAIEFQPWPKIARLNRDITITEKIDGTNAAVVIVERPLGSAVEDDPRRISVILGVNNNNPDADGLPELEYHVYAQSRTHFITPRDDNFGFAGWVERNAEALVEVLGEGTHFGEWWGAGIQRGYGLLGKDAPNGNRRFSLFNTGRWRGEIASSVDHPKVPGLRRVPILYRGLYSEDAITGAVAELQEGGSCAELGYLRPEGIVVWHEAARTSFKVTLEGDEAPKSISERGLAVAA